MPRTVYDMMLPWRERDDIPILDTSALMAADTVREVERLLVDLRE